MTAPPTRDELHAARDYLVGVFPLRFETPPAVVGAIAGLLIHGLPMDELDRYRPAIEAVSDADVHAAAARPRPAVEGGGRPRRRRRRHPARARGRGHRPDRSSSARPCPVRAPRPTPPDPARPAAPADPEPRRQAVHPPIPRGLPGRIIQSFPALGSPRLPPIPARLDDPDRRLVHAADRPGLARARAHELAGAARPDRRGREPPDPVPRGVRGRARRPDGPTTAPDRRQPLPAPRSRSRSRCWQRPASSSTGTCWSWRSSPESRSRSRCPRLRPCCPRSSTGRRSATPSL